MDLCEDARRLIENNNLKRQRDSIGALPSSVVATAGGYLANSARKQTPAEQPFLQGTPRVPRVRLSRVAGGL